ncbi:patatin-like phospholipase family protein [Shewanella sp. NIFS-20-20]|uniref:patatin-like phospholipase family protein n=1 Tax=Shewanella sp. NIFS-20-20 TaxID=2853806 RepID=UPI001C43A89C|nr:patatin-like phospholipase family protein [Shewanella sp. NIFS-20-20]MBV7316236.1 patatin-like phospholipase family protein [Shewanella sp. NIFS-20-20]
MPAPTIGLVLGGGGARAAYQVGVLKAIVQLYPRNHGIPFTVICGTSAGAINGTAMASYASCFHLGVRKLEWVWRNMQTAHIYGASYRAVGHHLLKMMLRGLQNDNVIPDAGSLLDNEPLRHLLEKVIDFQRIDRNIQLGFLRAVSVETSCYNDASNYCFFQAQHQVANWQRHKRFGIRQRLYTEHLLASAAIPTLFPSIKIRKSYHGDGSIHQQAPLSSPIHLGADKLFVINLESVHKEQAVSLPHHPRLAGVAGHLLDSIFSDTLNTDLERLHRVNQTLSQIPTASRQSLSLKPVETLVIKPSEDMSLIAAKYYLQMPKAVRTLLKVLGVNQDSDSSILSYLLFEKEYTRQLVQLGYQDAMCQLDEIKHFFQIPS